MASETYAEYLLSSLAERDMGWRCRRRTWRSYRRFYGRRLATTSLDRRPHGTGIKYVNPIHAMEPGTRRGLAAFSGAVEKFLMGGDMADRAGTAHALGDHVAVVIRCRAHVMGRGRGGGPRSALWTLRDGEVVRYAWFHEPDDAIEAAGLSGVGDVAGERRGIQRGIAAFRRRDMETMLELRDPRGGVAPHDSSVLGGG